MRVLLKPNELREELGSTIIDVCFINTSRETIATHVVHNLILAGLVRKVVADTRRKTEPGVNLRNEVWDSVVSAKLAKVCLGSESSGKETRYQATSKLLNLRKQWELQQLVDTSLDRNTTRTTPTRLALVVLHSGKIDLSTGKPLVKDEQKELISFPDHIRKHAQRNEDNQADPRAVQNGLQYFREIEDLIDTINRSNLQFTWMAEVNGRAIPVNPMIRQVHVGRFFNAARLYGWGELSGQSLPKKIRRTILLDGEGVAELDYSGLHTRMLYHLSKIRPEGDVYKPERVFPVFYDFGNVNEQKRAILRNFVKRATNVCWNTTKRVTANGAVRKLMYDDEDSRTIRKVVYNIEDMKGPQDVVARIIKAHPLLRNDFFSGVGSHLMTLDGKIMLKILSEFAQAKKPVLGIHDSVVCRLSDVGFAQQTMIESYEWLITQKPVVSRVY